MYAVSKLTQDSQDFLNKVKNDKPSLIGLAKAIVQFKAIPGSEVEDIDLFYVDNHFTAVREAIGSINEIIVIDTAFVIETAKALWKARAYAAHPSKEKPYVLPGISTPNDVFGFGQVIAPELSAIINQSAFEIMDSYLGFVRVLADISKEEV